MRQSGKPLILVANKSEGKGTEAGLLESYSLGLGVPFVAVSLSVPGLRSIIGRIGRGTALVQGVAGVLLAAVGALLLTMSEQHVSGFIAVFWMTGIVADTPPVQWVAWPSVVAFWALPYS